MLLELKVLCTYTYIWSVWVYSKILAVTQFSKWTLKKLHGFRESTEQEFKNAQVGSANLRCAALKQSRSN